MQQLPLIFKTMSTRGKVAAVAGLVGALVVFVLLARIATAPSYETMLTGVDPAEAGKITAALDEKGLAYKLENGGTALAVQPAQAAQARIALAEQGLGGGAKSQPGFELFDEQKLGTSDFQQQVNYQRALEGEIANTIEGVDGVSGAQVQLVLPEEELFAEDRRPATAAVLLSGASGGLDPGAVRGMAQLVSSSVEGLALDKVTITDGAGQLLWPREGGADGGFGGSTSKLAAEQRRDQSMESRLNAMLATTLGPGKAQVQVSSQLNVDKAKERVLDYADEGVALREKTEDERLQGTGARAGGRAGADGNIPGYAAGAAGGGDSNYRRNSDETDFGVDKTVRDREIAPGAVERQSVSVLVDTSVPAAVVTDLEAAMSTAAGVDAQRGDTITVTQVPFARPEAPKPEPAMAGMMGYAKWVALGLAALLFLFLVVRGLRKREREALGEPLWLREVDGPQSLAALEAQATVALPAPRANASRQRAEHLAASEPEKVAQQLRQWMHGEEN